MGKTAQRDVKLHRKSLPAKLPFDKLAILRIHG
jgi:hypothetical protein